MSRLKELEAEFDPAYQQSDDYSFWKKQNDIASEISSIKRQLRQQGVAEAKSPQEFMTQISKSDSSILTNKKESPYYAAGKMLSKYADKIGQDSMDFADFKQHAALLMGGPEANMKSAKQVRNLDTAASDIILDMIWEYSSTQKDADTYFKISGFKRLREGTQSITLGKGYTGRETKDGVWRVFKDGKAVAVAGPFKTREEASAWIKKQKQGVAEGLAPGQAAWKKEMMAKGAVSFKRDQHGGGAVDRIVAYDKDGKVVGGFNRKGVAEGLDPETTRLEQDVRNALENGDDYTAKQYAKMAPTPEAKKYLLNIIKQEMYGTDPEQGVAEGLPNSLSASDYMPGPVMHGDSENVPYNNKRLWDSTVDRINAKIFDDNSEYIGDSKGKRIEHNGVIWALWNNDKNIGWVNIKGRQVKPWPIINRTLGEQGVAEGKSTYGDGKEMYVGIEAYGVRGMKSTPWSKKFKNQAAFEKWLDSTEGDVEVYGTREINLNDFPVKNPR
jgi:hypothetical protein